jgi:hypothetical protein
MKEVALCLKDLILPGVSVTSNAVISLEKQIHRRRGSKKMHSKIQTVYNCIADIAVNNKESGSLGLYN